MIGNFYCNTFPGNNNKLSKTRQYIIGTPTFGTRNYRATCKHNKGECIRDRANKTTLEGSLHTAADQVVVRRILQADLA